MSNVTSNDDPVQAEPEIIKAPWGPLYAVIGTIITYIGSLWISQLVISVFLQASGWSKSHIDYTFNHTVVAQFWSILLAETATIAVLWLFIMRYPRSVWQKGIGLRHIKWRDLGYTLIGVLAYFGVYTVVLTLINSFVQVNASQTQELGFNHVVGTTNLMLTFASLVILPPIVEEIMFRGFLYGGLRKRLHVIPAVLITSLIFALPHSAESGDGSVLWIAAIDTFSLSLVLCYLREKTGAIYAGIGLHAIKNGIAFVSLFILHLR